MPSPTRLPTEVSPHPVTVDGPGLPGEATGALGAASGDGKEPRPLSTNGAERVSKP